jgi:hypothetical protein
LRNWHQVVEAQSLHTWHRRHRLAAIVTVENENGINEVVNAEVVFSNQSTREVVAAEPAWPIAWVGAEGRKVDSHGVILTKLRRFGCLP